MNIVNAATVQYAIIVLYKLRRIFLFTFFSNNWKTKENLSFHEFICRLIKLDEIYFNAVAFEWYDHYELIIMQTLSLSHYRLQK